MKLGIDKKIALVTGGFQGIGCNIALNLLNEGTVVIKTSKKNQT